MEYVFYIPSAPLVLICDFPKPQRGERCIVRIDPTNSKPQRGERCIKPTNVFHSINTYCRIRVWYSALIRKPNLSTWYAEIQMFFQNRGLRGGRGRGSVRKPNLPGRTQGTNYPGNPIILKILVQIYRNSKRLINQFKNNW